MLKLRYFLCNMSVTTLLRLFVDLCSDGISIYFEFFLLRCCGILLIEVPKSQGSCNRLFPRFGVLISIDFHVAVFGRRE